MVGRLLIHALIAAVLIGSSACDIAMSAKLPPVRDDRIVGEWRTPDDPETLLVKSKDGGYIAGSAREFAEGKATAFEIARAGKFLVVQISEPSCSDFGSKPCTIIHGVLDVAGNEVRNHQLDPEFMLRKSMAKAVPFPHFITRKSLSPGNFDTKVLLDGTPDQVSSTLTKWLQDRTAFQKITRLTRVK